MVRTMRVDHAVAAGAALDVELEEEISLTAARTCGTDRARTQQTVRLLATKHFGWWQVVTGVDVSGLRV